MLQGKTAASLMSTDANKAASLYESAMKKDPYNANYYLDYTQLMYSSYMKSHNSADVGKMRKSLDKLLEMNITDSRQSSVIVNMF
jgi:hypothetical protein